MDVEAFTSRARGDLRRSPRGYWAFHPEPLPRTLELPAATVRHLTDATAALYRLGGLGRLLPNPDLLILPYLRAEAVLSSKIEGTVSTISDLLLARAHEAHQVPAGDVEEVINYLRAMTHGLQRLDEGLPLCLRLVREMHEILLTGVRGQRGRLGEFRDDQNWIGAPDCAIEDATFVPPPAEQLPSALADWERFLHDAAMPLLVQLALAHYQFEAIHPFFDGNGRIGRLLLSLTLVDRGALVQPLLYLSAYFERHRSAYYRHLLEVSQSGDPLPWITFFLEAVLAQARDAEERTLRLVDGQRALRERLMADQAPTSVLALAEHVFVDPYVTSTTAMEALQATRPTALKAIDALVQRGVLREITGRRRGRTWFAPDIFQAVYGDFESARDTDDDTGEPSDELGTVDDRRRHG